MASDSTSMLILWLGFEHSLPIGSTLLIVVPETNDDGWYVVDFLRHQLHETQLPKQNEAERKGQLCYYI